MIGLKFIREATNTSLEKLSEEIGVSLQSINQWEKGIRPIPEARLSQLELLLKIPKKHISAEITIDVERYLCNWMIQYWTYRFNKLT